MYNAESWDKTYQKHVRYNRHHQEVWNKLVELGVLKGNVVDLGCGPCVMYEGKSLSLVGVDWSEEALKQARLHYPCGMYIQADVRNTGLPSGQFDTVIMLGLLDYFDDWEPILAEARRLLKQDGRILATLLNGFNGRDWTNYPRVAGNWHLAIFGKCG